SVIRIFALIALPVLLCTMLAPTLAQDSEWTLEQHCMPGAVHLPDDSAFAGAIFTADNRGIHASRADRTTSYIIAFEGRNFTPVGDFSPDGRWFAVPYGRVEYGNMLENRYVVTEWRVYSTGLDQAYHVVPFSHYDEHLPLEVLYTSNDALLTK